MSKPKDKTDAKIRSELKRLDQFSGMDEQYKREEKRQLKAMRNRHDRRIFKKDLANKVKDLQDDE